MRDRIGEKVESAARRLKGRFYRSRRGVPIALVPVDLMLTVSVCWFNRTRRWKVFWPWEPGNYEKEQQSAKFFTLDEVETFIGGMREHAG
jgi:hypothetical protein